MKNIHGLTISNLNERHGSRYKSLMLSVVSVAISQCIGTYFDFLEKTQHLFTFLIKIKVCNANRLQFCCEL